MLNALESGIHDCIFHENRIIPSDLCPFFLEIAMQFRLDEDNTVQ